MMRFTKTIGFAVITILVSSNSAWALDKFVDNRTPMQVDEAAKTHVLLEMRQLLEAVQLVMDSALKDDMAAVSAYASAVGLKAMKATPKNVAHQLPMEFKMMGRAVHEAMDGIARDARDLGDGQHTLEQLNTTLKACVACHQTFKLK